MSSCGADDDSAASRKQSLMLVDVGADVDRTCPSMYGYPLCLRHSNLSIAWVRACFTAHESHFSHAPYTLCALPSAYQLSDAFRPSSKDFQRISNGIC